MGDSKWHLDKNLDQGTPKFIPSNTPGTRVGPNGGKPNLAISIFELIKNASRIQFYILTCHKIL